MEGDRNTANFFISLSSKYDRHFSVGYPPPDSINESTGVVCPAHVEELLEKAIEKKFGFHVAVMVRTTVQWKKYVIENPFSEAAKNRPKFLNIGLSKLPCNKNLPVILAEKATLGEKIELISGAIWVDFSTGIGKSGLTPTLFDKAAGSPVTMRNWNTVLKIDEMLRS